MVAHPCIHRVFARGSTPTRDESDLAEAAAATMIQRLWRGRHNRAKDEFLTPEIRWVDIAIQAKLQVDREAAFDGKNTPLQRWRRVVFMVGRLRDQNQMLKGVTELDVGDAEVKQLETQHWLELIDGKHRYGSNRNAI
ncbi:hypothetical protein P691DRAFT_17786 [Macrolepiota fuliginosa MF-IS2]|uniref:Uncharacterized protein n=1 Tax=Macrolepiota fuliginosa MF-IS2 TaxID=1400762 RepID=A0A9P6C7G9_9AGAR|nr:hypothetical protein P691DRAFT_17786 [Macrolepiota fuliginosa MF-IS2]